MKRFWKEAGVVEAPGGFGVHLDGRRVRTQGGSEQVVPSRDLALALAAEWADQGETVDPARFVFRDLADFAIDVIAPDPAPMCAGILRFAESDTLCYRAEPDEPLAARQSEVWSPIVAAAEARWQVKFISVSGIIHRAQPPETLGRLGQVLAECDPFTLSALNTLASLAASLIVALSAIERGADIEALWRAAQLEELWQAELWGQDAEAEARRARHQAAFISAARFAGLV